MGRIVTTESTRRDLQGRQADKVERLLDAALEEVRATGYGGFTVRNAARRAGVAPATAYTYFACKDHLIAEVFWRRLDRLPTPAPAARRSAAARAADAFREIALVVAAEPELAAASTTAVLADDPDVRRIRDGLGAAIVHRLSAALGEHVDRAALQTLELAFSGAMLQAGMGYLAYTELGDRMAEVADVVLRP